ncbi:MAG TPA: ferrous iron transport protein B [Clostridiaceae bacterium]|jgi:ferrous iron transport protein B|nr:ferrous iron transport protein B [Clostridiaceae bacterium]
MAKESLTFALMGNQNSGKTTLFNRLTGSQLHVSNFPGVTVERKSGYIRDYPDSEIVDLPGIYSLSPYSPEEVISRNFLIKETPDCILNVVDATSLERGLYLTLQLIELDIPMTVALNMIDEMPALGRQVDVDQLSKELGIPVVAISASQNEGVSEYMRVSMETAINGTKPLKPDLCSGPVHRAIHAISVMIEDHAEEVGVTPRFAATKLIEGDELFVPELGLNQNELEAVEHIVVEMERDLETDRLAALADMRYAFIGEVESKVLRSKYPSYEEAPSVTLTLDRILLHRWFGIPIFLAVMTAVSWISFGPFGQFLNDVFADAISKFGEYVGVAMSKAEINPTIQSLVIDGIFSGVGSVVSFLPMILVLFFLLSLLEVTGYMARVAFIMDRLMRKIGLSGASIVPLLLGFGCSVPAVMATRTLPSRRDRLLTVLLVPFMSCSAKIPVYGLIAAAIFPNHVALVIPGLYLLGIVLGVITALFLRRTVFRGEASPFLLELPPYRFPSLTSLGRLVKRHAKEFMVRAFTVILLVTLLIWVLETYDFRFYPAASPESSMLAVIASKIAPIFAPLGFNSTPAVSALLAGFSAKETIISTLTVAISGSDLTLTESLQQLLTTPAAISFLIFILLYTPCAAAVAVMHRELAIRGGLFLIVAFQTIFAWSIAFIAYRLALLFGKSIPLFLASLVGLIALIALFLALLKIRSKKQHVL